jgi:FKBP-type peptidyl-prolyl cis-trans isomerase FkpA
MKKSFYLIFVKSKITLAFLIFIFLFSCGKDNPEYQAEVDREIILKYIEDNNLDAAEVDDTGVFYVISTEGGGNFPNSQSLVYMVNKGFYIDKDDEIVVFQEQVSQYYQLSMQILGWQYGVPKFNKGAKGLLLIPSAFAYGPYPYYVSVPPNQVVFYEIELIDFQ